VAPQIVHEIRPRRLTVAGAAAIASLVFTTWAFVPEAYSTSDVENCDSTLRPAAPGLDFSGVFEGSIVDGGQSTRRALEPRAVDHDPANARSASAVSPRPTISSVTKFLILRQSFWRDGSLSSGGGSA
jgi:hypothetical protein